MQETQVESLGQEDPLEKGMATHSSILAWRLPWTEEPAGLQSMGLQRVRHTVAEANLIWVSGLAHGVRTACTPSPSPGGQGLPYWPWRPDILSQYLLWPHLILCDE